MNKVRLGIIGQGNMGSTHLKNYLDGLMPEIEVVAIADLLQDRIDKSKEKLEGKVATFLEGEDLIKSGVCDAVLIATPHYAHPALAIKAFEAGLHVMCEKPAGVYTLQVREMNEAAAKTDKIFGMMFNQRTSANYRKMKELVETGEIGEIKRVNWIVTDWYRTQIYYDSGSWRATWDGEGGGVLLNQCPHNLDLMQWICGMPSKVTAFCHEGKWHDIEVEDDVTAYLEFSNGATGVFVTSTGDAPGTNRFEITGTKGRLICENGKIHFTKLKMDEREFCVTSENGFGKPEVEEMVVETDGLSQQHVGVMNKFAAAILRGEDLVAHGAEGINGLMLSNAMHLSSWTGKSVELPIDEKFFLEELNKKRATSKLKEEKAIIFHTDGSY